MEVWAHYSELARTAVQMTGALLVLKILFGFLNCFLGYRLLKIWVTLCGFFLGIGGGFVVGKMLFEQRNAILLTGAAAGVILAVVAYQVYLVGAFLLGWALTVFGFYSFGISMGLSPKQELAALVAGAFLGIAVGAILVKFSRPGIILLTALSGGISIGSGVIGLLQTENSVLMMMISCVAALAGIWLQFHMNSL